MSRVEKVLRGKLTTPSRWQCRGTLEAIGTVPRLVGWSIYGQKQVKNAESCTKPRWCRLRVRSIAVVISQKWLKIVKDDRLIRVLLPLRLKVSSRKLCMEGRSEARQSANSVKVLTHGLLIGHFELEAQSQEESRPFRLLYSLRCG